jgi:hypothetical protein
MWPSSTLHLPVAAGARKRPSLLAILCSVRYGHFRSACAQQPRNNRKAPCSKPEKSSANWLGGSGGRGGIWFSSVSKSWPKSASPRPHLAFLAAKKCGARTPCPAVVH